jgi:hypothetical protein
MTDPKPPIFVKVHLGLLVEENRTNGFNVQLQFSPKYSPIQKYTFLHLCAAKRCATESIEFYNFGCVQIINVPFILPFIHGDE